MNDSNVAAFEKFTPKAAIFVGPVGGGRSPGTELETA